MGGCIKPGDHMVRGNNMGITELVGLMEGYIMVGDHMGMGNIMGTND